MYVLCWTLSALTSGVCGLPRHSRQWKLCTQEMMKLRRESYGRTNAIVKLKSTFINALEVKLIWVIWNWRKSRCEATLEQVQPWQSRPRLGIHTAKYPGGSMPHSQVLSINPCPEPNQPYSSYWYIFL